MFKKILLVAILIVAVCSGRRSAFSQAAVAPEKLRDVDVFLGVDGDGNTTPGAQVPFGLVVLQPDTERPSTSGYRSDSRIVGFSHTHESGTGGASKYGNFRVVPFSGPLEIPVAAEKSDEAAWPGYYAVTLGPPTQPIRAELTAARLVGFHRYTFPPAKDAHLVVEVSSAIVSWSGTPQRPLSCEAKADPSGELSGNCKFRGGWNPGDYQLYFVAQFDRKPARTGVGNGSNVSNGRMEVSTTREWEPAWAWASFDTTENSTVQLKLAISFLSIEKAKLNLREVEGWNFDKARNLAQAQWSDALSKISIEGGSAEQRQIFYSSLYRAHVMPHDVSGENAWWKSDEPHYEDYYTLWDTFRTQDPLLTVIQPDRARDIVRSMVDTFRHTGWMPDARIAGSNGLTQGGSNGDVLVADAIVKGLRGIDYQAAYQALVKNAESDSPDPLNEGREKMSVYKKVGYVPLEEERSGSRTMEYAYDDFAISQVAEALGKRAAAAEYRRRSLFWANLWDKDSLAIHPRYADGRWMTPFDRGLTTNPWSSPFYEGSPWQYSTYVPHDVQGLINRIGGDAAFVAWLDQFFAEDKYEPGNEPDMLAAWLYIHAGRPDKTQSLVRHLLAKYYRTGRTGLPGNDDAGAMTSWYVWSAIGLYPNAGQDYYYLASPVFSKVRVQVAEGKQFEIDAPSSTPENQYIQSATLNGHPLNRAWLKHSELAAGGRLELILGPKASDWGRQDRPYSVESEK